MASFNGVERPPESLHGGSRIVTPLGFRPNAHFVGFEAELRKLHRRLQHERRREIGSCAVLVWGEVGCGKTHLTRQYFYRHRRDFPEGSFWVDCRTRESITKGLWDIGVTIGALDQDRQPGPDDFAAAVKQRLESLEGWLLVFDGLLESDESLSTFRNYVPDRRGNCIIYTSVDRTLALRHRLLNPSALKVGKLSISDATDLLYQELGLRQPTSMQQEKALDLVRDNDCLPLAIYAAAHALIERGKSLERYAHTSHDQRLVRPFLDILGGLRDQGRTEAVNLVSLLSFFTHHIPVALIRYGYGGLLTPPFNVDILSPKYAQSSRKDLDSSISILLRSGLLERTLQTWTRSSGSSSPEETRSMKRGAGGLQLVNRGQGQHFSNSLVIRTLEETPPTQLPEESSGLEDLVVARFESRDTHVSYRSTQPIIDTLRIHTVVQNVIRNDLKEKPLAGEHDYWWWLCAAVRLLTHSYRTANERLRSGIGLIRDYREYEAQAARLLSLFPRSPGSASTSLRHARREVRDLLKTVQRELHNQSPSQSVSSRQQYQGSIFERSSSTSGGSPTMDSLSPTSTWGTEPPSDSPVQIHSDLVEFDTLGRPPFPDDSAVILSDEESWPSMSDITETPNRQSRRSSVLYAILEGKPRIRQKDLGEFHEFKALPAPPSLSQPNIVLPESARTSSETRKSRPSSSSTAEAALAAMHRSSPPPSRGGRGRLRSASRSSSDRPPLTIKSGNTPLSPLAAEFEPSIESMKGAKVSNAARSRNPSSSPRLVQALLTSQANTWGRPDLPPLQIDHIDVHYSSQDSIRPQTAVQHRHSQARPLPQIQPYVPSGYQSVPMSRDTSRESNVTGTSNLPSGPAQRTFSDQYVLSTARVAEWANIAPSEPVSQRRESEALQFGTMDPVSIAEARARATVARERSAERGRGRSRGSAAHSGVGSSTQGQDAGVGR